MTTPHDKALKLQLGDMPSYGICTANDMLRALAEARYGDRDMSLLREIDNERPIGHQGVPFINFNSLNRIISAFHAPIPEAVNGGDGWLPVPDEMTRELIAAATKDRQVLVYENGRYYNAWLEFDEYEGGWLWMDEADSEPNPTHYRPLPVPPSTPSNEGREKA